MKIVFFGSDDFAAVHLKALIKERHQVIACVTQSDSRQGRGMKVVVSPIKAIAQQQGLLCLQPSTLKEPQIIAELSSLAADIFVVVAYGKLLSQEILDIPKIFCVNVHGSLLPKYRGAAPINWAILNGDKETGISIQKMSLALDAGDIIAQVRIPITEHANAQELREIMAYEGAELLCRTLKDIEIGDYTLTPQDDEQSNYACKLTKEMGRIDWTKHACSIFNQVRGLQPWPGSYTMFQNRTLKVLQAQVLESAGSGQPGQVTQIDKRGIVVSCGNGALLITLVHPEASKIMPAVSFVAGHKIKVTDAFN